MNEAVRPLLEDVPASIFTAQDIERFWSKVEKLATEAGCWIWIGCCNKSGYGEFWAGSRKYTTHRLSLTLHGRPIPVGMCGCHKCDTPSCVNQDHLFIGSALDNVRDKVTKGRQAKGAIHGSHLHPELRRGVLNGRAKLTEESVRSLRAEYANGGVFQSVIARKYGVTQAVGNKILNGTLWRHVV